jgi:hypothetical protein
VKWCFEVAIKKIEFLGNSNDEVLRQEDIFKLTIGKRVCMELVIVRV